MRFLIDHRTDIAKFGVQTVDGDEMNLLAAIAFEFKAAGRHLEQQLAAVAAFFLAIGIVYVRHFLTYF